MIVSLALYADRKLNETLHHCPFSFLAYPSLSLSHTLCFLLVSNIDFPFPAMDFFRNVTVSKLTAAAASNSPVDDLFFAQNTVGFLSCLFYAQFFSFFELSSALNGLSSRVILFKKKKMMEGLAKLVLQNVIFFLLYLLCSVLSSSSCFLCFWFLLLLLDFFVCIFSLNYFVCSNENLESDNLCWVLSVSVCAILWF